MRSLFSFWSSSRCYTVPARLKNRLNRKPPSHDPFSANVSPSPVRTTPTPFSRIFVSGLPLTVTWEELKDHFKTIGPVIYASISKDMTTNVSKGCGLVQFEKESDVEKSIELLNGKIFKGSVIQIKKDLQGRGNKEERDRKDVGFKNKEKDNDYLKKSNGNGKNRVTDNKSTTSEKIEKRERKTPSTSSLLPPLSSTRDSDSPLEKKKEVKPTKRDIPEAEEHEYRVFVSGLPLTYKWTDLKDYFKSIGPVRYCDIYTHMDSGKSRGTAVVEFERKNDVMRAVELLNGALLEPEKMMIRVAPFDRRTQNEGSKPSISQQSSSSASSPSPNSKRLLTVSTINPLVPILRQTPLPEEIQKSLAVFSDSRVFVNHLPRDLDWKIVKDTFSAIGPVAHVEIIPDSHTGKSRGCGFIKYKSVSDAKKAIEVLHHSVIEGQQIEVLEYHEDRDNRRDRTWRRSNVMKIRLPSEREEKEEKGEKEKGER